MARLLLLALFLLPSLGSALAFPEVPPGIDRKALKHCRELFLGTEQERLHQLLTTDPRTPAVVTNAGLAPVSVDICNKHGRKSCRSLLRFLETLAASTPPWSDHQGRAFTAERMEKLRKSLASLLAVGSTTASASTKLEKTAAKQVASTGEARPPSGMGTVVKATTNLETIWQAHVRLPGHSEFQITPQKLVYRFVHHGEISFAYCFSPQFLRGAAQIRFLDSEEDKATLLDQIDRAVWAMDLFERNVHQRFAEAGLAPAVLSEDVCIAPGSDLDVEPSLRGSSTKRTTIDRRKIDDVVRCYRVASAGLPLEDAVKRDPQGVFKAAAKFQNRLAALRITNGDFRNDLYFNTAEHKLQMIDFDANVDIIPPDDKEGDEKVAAFAKEVGDFVRKMVRQKGGLLRSKSSSSASPKRDRGHKAMQQLEHPPAAAAPAAAAENMEPLQRAKSSSLP